MSGGSAASGKRPKSPDEDVIDELPGARRPPDHLRARRCAADKEDCSVVAHEGGFWRLNTLLSARQGDNIQATLMCARVFYEIVECKGRFCTRNVMLTIRGLLHFLYNTMLVKHETVQGDPYHIGWLDEELRELHDAGLFLPGTIARTEVDKKEDKELTSMLDQARKLFASLGVTIESLQGFWRPEEDRRLSAYAQLLGLMSTEYKLMFHGTSPSTAKLFENPQTRPTAGEGNAYGAGFYTTYLLWVAIAFAILAQERHNELRTMLINNELCVVVDILMFIVASMKAEVGTLGQTAVVDHNADAFTNDLRTYLCLLVRAALMVIGSMKVTVNLHTVARLDIAGDSRLRKIVIDQLPQNSNLREEYMIIRNLMVAEAKKLARQEKQASKRTRAMQTVGGPSVQTRSMTSAQEGGGAAAAPAAAGAASAAQHSAVLVAPAPPAAAGAASAAQPAAVLVPQAPPAAAGVGGSAGPSRFSGNGGNAGNPITFASSSEEEVVDSQDEEDGAQAGSV